MRATLLLFTAVTLALALAGCRGRGPFIPAPGPLTGTFTSGDAVIGDFTLTTSAGAFAGTGTLALSTGPVPIAISGTVSSRTVTGQLSNSDAGSGVINGSFATTAHASGTFTFLPNGGLPTVSGTWVVDATP